MYLRSDDTGSVTAPSHPHIQLGEANPDDSAQDRRFRDHSSAGWTQDSNSPWFVNTTNIQTFTLADRYDQWRLWVAMSGESFSDDIAIQINGQMGR